MSTRVGAVKLSAGTYPDEPPYSPSEAYPEYPFKGHLARRENPVYAGVRRLFVELGLDAPRYNTSGWNPLGRLISPGMKVVLKPNFVRSRHYEHKDPYSMITHPSVLRAIADYCWIALEGTGRIIIADAPQYDANWAELLELTKLGEVCTFYAAWGGPQVELRDLRRYWSRARHFQSMVIALPGDPEGASTINLGKKSALYAHPDPTRLYGAVYHRAETIRHHTGDQQIYEMSATVMNADVVISVPKLKTHKKVGVTLNIKGLVGICTNKNLIVHYSLGPPSEGGDQYPDGHFTPMEERLIKIERWMYDALLARRNILLEYLHRSVYWLHETCLKPFGIKVAKEKRLLDAGNWHGNDSAWRMAADVMNAFTFADRKGQLRETPQRRTFAIVDGIVGGENRGPLEPDPKPAGVLVGGDNFLAVDIVSTRLMGFDPMKVKVFRHLLAQRDFDLGVRSCDQIEVRSAEAGWAACLSSESDRFLDFRPHPGWVGFLEAGDSRSGRASDRR
jgi:uncharacterized protein (DUF362 family)